MARAIWKGIIGFGDVEVPVKLYSAIQQRTVHFRLLHESDDEPVRQRMVNPESGKAVETEKIKRGYEVEPGTFVMLDPEELEEAAPPPSRDIGIDAFVPVDAIPHAYFERAYYLGPDGDDEAYFTLASALADTERQGVARWVMRKRYYAGALRANGDYLMLLTLRNANEVVPASALPTPGGRSPDEREVRMAKQLVAALEGDFNIEDYDDEYRKRLMTLVRKKAKGGVIEIAEYRAKKETEAASLADILAASLEGVKEGGRTAKRASGGNKRAVKKHAAKSDTAKRGAATGHAVKSHAAAKHAAAKSHAAAKHAKGRKSA
jgi:DNA end-binding protein Ku